MKRNGFTLVEMLVVISIAAILAAIGIPSFRGMLNDFRQKSALGLVVNDLNHARAEAIKRNTRILVCVRDAAGTGCATGTNWQAGWLVCSDSTTAGTTPELPPSDGLCDAGTAANPNPLIVRPALDAALTLTSTASAVRFNANSSQGSAGAEAILTLGGTWSGVVSREIKIAGTGNISK
jgi:type IV fimbrial biogenesis protein FimT